MSKREYLLKSLLSTKTTLEIIEELRKLPIEDKEFHVIPYGTVIYRIKHTYCSKCSHYYNGGRYSSYAYCKIKHDGRNEKEFCPPDIVEKGWYAGNDDSDFGITTFFTEQEAKSHILQK